MSKVKSTKKIGNPLKADPTRLTTLRRVFGARISGKFTRLEKKIRDLIVKSNAFDIQPTTNLERKGSWNPVDDFILSLLETNEFNENQPRDEEGRFASYDSGHPGYHEKKQSKGILGLLKRIGGAIGHAEHVAKEYISEKVENAVLKIPSATAQDLVRGSFALVRVGTSAAFATWTMGQAFAERVARKRGLSEEAARRLRGILAATDLALTKPVLVAGEVAHLSAPVLMAASMVPPATASYLAYSTARAPLATARAATDLAREGGRAVAKGVEDYTRVETTAALANRPRYSSFELERIGNSRRENEWNPVANADSESTVDTIAEVLEAHHFDDWYIALLSASFDWEDNLADAILLANEIYERVPRHIQTGRINIDQDAEIVLGEGYRRLRDHGFTPTSNVEDFSYYSTPQKLVHFREWIKRTIGEELGNPSNSNLWKEYVANGYKKGVERSFDETRGVRKVLESPEVFEGSKREFLSTSLRSPRSVEATQILASRSLHDLEGVTNRMSTVLSRILTDGFVSHKSPEDIADEMSKEVSISRNRALLIANTEITRAFSAGQLDAMKSLGVDSVGVNVEWDTRSDGKVCNRCSSLNNKKYSLDNARGVIPAHPNCRCCWTTKGVNVVGKGSKVTANSYRGVYNSDNCGTGSGGFKEGNTCRGGSKLTKSGNRGKPEHTISFRQYGKKHGLEEQEAYDKHRKVVEDALSRGEEVPLSVLKDHRIKLPTPSPTQPIASSPTTSPTPVPTSSEESTLDTPTLLNKLREADRSGDNLVHLGDLLEATGVSKDTLHRAIERARKAGKISLSGAEGRFGLTERDKESIVRERGIGGDSDKLLLYASVRNEFNKDQPRDKDGKWSNIEDSSSSDSPMTKDSVRPGFSSRKEAISTLVNKARRSDLPDDLKDTIERAITRVFRDMPEKAIERMGENLSNVSFYPTPEALTRRWEKDTGLRKTGSGVVNGYFNHNTGEAVLDGPVWKTNAPGLGGDQKNVYGAYAHELTHALDKGLSLSSTAEWTSAYSDEIANPKSPRTTLSEYAKTNTAEGFAEFGRMLYGSEVDRVQAERKFQKCFSFFRSRGLWEGDNKVTTNRDFLTPGSGEEGDTGDGFEPIEQALPELYDDGGYEEESGISWDGTNGDILMGNEDGWEGLDNAFCPTGEGGGIDPSCSPGKYKGGSVPSRPKGHKDWGQLAKKYSEKEFKEMADKIIEKANDKKFTEEVDYQAGNYVGLHGSGLQKRPETLRARAAIETYAQDIITKIDKDKRKIAGDRGASAGHMINSHDEDSAWKEAWKVATEGK
jgi:SPP1 gp7 family putative phage head morphogenesis protein